MEKHKYSGKSKEEAIKKAQEELQELESNLFIREISETKAGLFKSKKVEIEVIEKRDVVQHIKEYLIKILRSMGITANIEIKNKDDVPTYCLLPAFILSELKTAFTIGFVIYLPFLTYRIFLKNLSNRRS